MKHFIIFISSLFLLIIQIHAKEKTDQTLSIKVLIKQIKNSSSDDRRIAMNKLKIKLRKMNKETRKKVMLDLQKSFATHNTGNQITYNKSDITNGSQPHIQAQQEGGVQHHAPIKNMPIRTTPTRGTHIINNPPRNAQPGGHR